MAKMETEISVEAVIHKQLMEALQKISDDHGIVVNDIKAEWEHVHLISGDTRSFLSRISLNTSGYRGVPHD